MSSLFLLIVVDFSSTPSTGTLISDSLSTQPDKASSIVKNWLVIIFFFAILKFLLIWTFRKKIYYGNFTEEDLKKSEEVKLKWEGLNELKSEKIPSSDLCKDLEKMVEDTNDDL